MVKTELEKQSSLTKMYAYSSMAFFFFFLIAAISSTVCYIIYSIESHGIKDLVFDEYEHDFGRMQISAYGAIISILFSILLCVLWVSYKVNKNLK